MLKGLAWEVVTMALHMDVRGILLSLYCGSIIRQDAFSMTYVRDPGIKVSGFKGFIAFVLKVTLSGAQD